MIKECCKNCKFYEFKKDYCIDELCHRYPQCIQTKEYNWCGEWKHRKKKTIKDD
jgi:hypothetical protein